MLRDIGRSLLFVITGVAVFAYWSIARPSSQQTASMQEWPTVLWFSATLLSVAIALLIFGRMVGGQRVVRWASMAGLGVGLSSMANIFEDGFRIEGFFFAFILGVWIMNISLFGLTIVIARTFGGRDRLLAIIPAGTFAGILLFVVAGGPIMLITWLGAATAALLMSGRSPIPLAPATP